ncbi:MAG: hypothetical protein ACFFB8_14540 [Promethearchaeota archaeon]
MKIIIQVKFEEIEKEFNGSGTKEDPIIIDHSEVLPPSFEIFESMLYITIKNCEFKHVALYYSENITIENCKFKILEMYQNSNIIIKDLMCSASILSQCNNCQIINSVYTREFCFFKSHNNSLKNNKFEGHFSNPGLLSRGNIFENNKIHDKYKIELKNIDIPYMEEERTFLLNAGSNKALTSEKLVECKGFGTKEDPIFIGAQEHYYPFVYISKNRYYLVLDNFNPDYLVIFDSRNITIKNSNFKSCDLFYCRNLNLNNINTKIIKFGRCQDIIIEYSNIDKIKVHKGFEGNVTFKNCKINKINKKLIDSYVFID